MSEDFDNDPLGVAPPATPLPNPPADSFTWYHQQPLTTTVVVYQGFGNVVRIDPKPEFFTNPKVPKPFLWADSEPFSNDGTWTGGFSIRIQGDATIKFGLQTLHPSSPGDTGYSNYYIAGGQLTQFGSTARAYVLPIFTPDDISSPEQDVPTPKNVTSVEPGQWIHFGWKFSPDFSVFTLSVRSITGPKIEEKEMSVATLLPSPHPRLSLKIWLQDPGTREAPSSVFIDGINMQNFAW